MNPPGKQITNGFNGRLEKRFQAFFYDWMFGDEMSPEQVLETYFDPGFTAVIDWHSLSRAEFGSRIKRMRQEAVVQNQVFHQMMEDGDRLFSMHELSGVSLASGKPFETFAIAYFEFNDNRLLRGYLNSVTKGDARDRDIASQH
ncbi:hypothetical protein JM93_04087 [Roseibium hamelinense]|uniref:SnoaL-like protein n=1 Tax=Roseibium hamelinense TaxID=150831 RepID=A0A562SF24_9HYPH|nr:nuclear transport factor 2 family protein [Roseibium hamelinense]MTI44240.1 hypothetical protein [Roseibium hamelinense]TWI79975.1 hypothetical protein JM93_04087 [Roseibium hamelinense]